MNRSVFSLLKVGLFVFGLSAPGALVGQANDEARNWAAEGELGGSVFFGNSSQSAFTAALSGDRGRELLRLRGRAGFAYGEASNASGESFKNKEAWDVGARLDIEPGTAVGAFFKSKVESIFEKKIDLRYGVGAGGKIRAGGDAVQAEFDLGLLVEKTILDETSTLPDEVVGKWTAGFRLVRGMDEGRVRFETETSIEPELRDPGVFTLTSRSSLAFQLNQRIAVQFSFVDGYDTEAENRGARSNNDGQIFFGVVGRF
jgi:hypothetical protein